MYPIFNLTYPEIINGLFLNGNTDVVVVKEQPLDNNQFVNLITLAVQHGQEDNTNDAMLACKELFTKDGSGNKTLISTSVVIGSTTHPYGVEVFSDGNVIFKLKTYLSTEDAQNDLTLKIGAGFIVDGDVKVKV